MSRSRGPSPDADGPLLTRALVAVLALTFLGFSFEQILRPIIPLVVIERGGDASLVGLVVAMYALPSVLFRPLIGRVVDAGRHGQALRLGAWSAAIAPVGVLLPGIIPLAVVRFIQGTGWAFYGVSTHTLLAKVSRPGRRGQASGYYMAMPAAAALLVPGPAVAVYVATHEIGPVVVSCALGFAAVVLTSRTRIPASPPRMDTAGTPPAGADRAGLKHIVERSAVPGTTMLTMFMSGAALFMVFPPVYAVAIGAPLETLVLYYPVFGLCQALSQFVTGRVADRLGSGPAIRIGCVLGIFGLAIALLGNGMLTLGAGAAIFAIGVSFVAPATSAMTIDRAPPERIGSAMALYSLGFQLATGASSLAWGAIIVTGGFFWAFAAAIGLQVLTLAVSLRALPRSTPSPRRRRVPPGPTGEEEANRDPR